MTQVPPTRYSSPTITRAPYDAARRAARPPPEPAPTTKRSMSLSGISRRPGSRWTRRLVSQRVSPLFHFVAHFCDDFFRQLVGPIAGEAHARFDDGWLRRQHLLACRRLVECQSVFELLLRKIRRVKPRDFVVDLTETRLQIRSDLCRDLIEVLAQARILLKKQNFGLLNHSGDQRIERHCCPLCCNQLLGELYRRS